METNYTDIPSREQLLKDKKNDIGWYVLSVITLIFSIKDNKLSILLEKRQIQPEKDKWMLPGKFLNYGRDFETTAKQKLKEIFSANSKKVYLEQLFTYVDPSKSLGKRVITTACLLLVPNSSFKKELEQSTSKNFQWFSIGDLPLLAFDHKSIINIALERLQKKISFSNVVAALLDGKFRLSTLQKVYEIILNKRLNKRNFRQKIKELDLLRATGEKEIEGAHRPAMLYQFKSREIAYIA